MSLGIVIKGPEGLVLAADSRVTVQTKDVMGKINSVNFDNATKLITFSDHPNIGLVTYGQPAIGDTLRTVHSFIPEFEDHIAKKYKEKVLSVESFAQEVANFFHSQWKLSSKIEDYKGPPMTIITAGYNKDEHFGRVYISELPYKVVPEERSPGPKGFGITWGGQREIVDRIILGYDSGIGDVIRSSNISEEQKKNIIKTMEQFQISIPYMLLPLQDCVNLASFLINATIRAQGLSLGIRGVGGPIDIAIIQRKKAIKFVQEKHIIGEKECEHESQKK